MYPLKIAFSSYAIIGITLLIVAITVAVYLSCLTSKTRATRALIFFFSCIALSGGATLLTNSLVHWGRLFTPWQDFWILAGGIALIQFAYLLPDKKVEYAFFIAGSLFHISSGNIIVRHQLLVCLYF